MISCLLINGFIFSIFCIFSLSIPILIMPVVPCFFLINCFIFSIFCICNLIALLTGPGAICILPINCFIFTSILCVLNLSALILTTLVISGLLSINCFIFTSILCVFNLSLILILAISVLAALCFTLFDYIYPIFSSIEVFCKPAADCMRNTVNRIQFQTYPETIRNLCQF